MNAEIAGTGVRDCRVKARVVLESVNVEAEIENLLIQVTINQRYRNLEKIKHRSRLHLFRSRSWARALLI